MKRRKLASLALALVMVLSLVPALGTTARADVTTNYTLEIPATLTVANSGWNATDGIRATGTLASGKKLTVTASSANSWALKSGDNSVGYKLATASTDTEATTSWTFDSLNSTATKKDMGIIVDDYSTKPAGTYQDTVTFTAKVESASVPVTAITLNKTETSIKVGSTETLSVTAVAPDNATDKTYTWKTSDASKATVDQDGKVTAVAAGTVTIYAEANDGSDVKGNCTVTVTPATITVTWNNSDISGYGTSFSKDGVTMNVTGELCDFMDKNFSGGTFTSTVGNFTKIEVTAMSFTNMGSGWAVSSGKATWTGTASSTVSFGGSDFMDGIWGMGDGVTMVFTIEPAN